MFSGTSYILSKSHYRLPDDVCFLRRRRRNKSEGAAHSEGDRADPHSSSFEIDSEMDFPTLGSSCDSKVMVFEL